MADLMNNDDKIYVCRCEEVTIAMVKEAIREGAMTVDAVKRRTRAGMGFCQGKTCGRLIARIISQETGRPLAKLLPATYRAPVRPIPISIITAENGGNKND